MSRPQPFYAIKWDDKTNHGGIPRIVRTWDDCTMVTKGLKGFKQKKFKTLNAAAEWVGVSEGELAATEGAPLRLKEEEEEESPSPTDELDMYTDGGCDDNGTVFAAAGFGVATFLNGKLAAEHAHALTFSPDHSPTNIRAELEGVCFALQNVLMHWTKGNIAKLRIHIDLQLALDYLLEEKSPSRNLDLVSRAEALLVLVRSAVPSVELCKVKGHSGVEGNERADELATEGKQMYAGVARAKKRARCGSIV